ncbi:CubicO group peptidase (beta-lactamase class C family) [Streptomyces sp. PanSC19]|uniref:serine hydrolase domain-containing protein n=1 Tax=Streptomyces sp. PanSC19 TaxID=1520455 RepID=UPI000FA4B139|nr:serine hydrolase domain-containing protein [Streptomyces sp. PanSC19]ROQ34855.1 CubicO group peptidase (beta-lactamase class C family) [Streptomyces sp. PanSC19]
MKELLTELALRHGVPGAQLAVWRDGLLSTAETGEEEAGSGRPVTAATAFPLGSLTKPFTATLTALLVADGDVDLDEPLAEQLGELRAGPDFTLRQVLSHTAGLAANTAEPPVGTTRARWLARHAAEQAVHEPGTVFSYSNPGYVIAGRLVEEITGLDWAEAVRTMLLRPLGHDAGAPTASGHLVRPDAPPRPIGEQSVPPLEDPAAGLCVSARDLAVFGAAHLGLGPGGALLDAATARAMREDVTEGLAVGAYGLADGWGAGWSRYGDWFGHDGTGDGAWSHLRVYPSTRTVVALTANGSTGARLWESLLGRLRETGPEIGDHPRDGHLRDGHPRDGHSQDGHLRETGGGGSVPAPAECAGHYANGDWSCRVEAEGGDLLLSVAGAAPVRLLVGADLSFRTPSGDGPRAAMPYLGRFLRDPATGAPDRVQITGRLCLRQG